MAPVELIRRLQVNILGAVQGTGFRPFLFRLAHRLHLNGWAANTSNGVAVEVEGSAEAIEAFLVRLPMEKPRNAVIHNLEYRSLDAAGYREFKIRESLPGAPGAALLPDIATCPQCLKELWNPKDRRYRYPFINCTHCGPRFTITEKLPYDRPNTSMKHFPLCAECGKEYQDSGNRRFHAQPNACPQCGPRLTLCDGEGKVLAQADRALVRAARLLRAGKILAVKGLGGFHLMCDSENEKTVQTLRRRKHRDEKPFALMAQNLKAIRRFCHVSPVEARLLQSSAAPIVLLRRRLRAPGPADGVAPGNPYLGIMLPGTPLHHLLLTDTGRTLVATSGNLGDEPVCYEDADVLQRLGRLADFFLMHDRPIYRHADDSIYRIMGGREVCLRRARGLTPLPVIVPGMQQTPVMACGAHMKNTIAVTVGNTVIVSQHIGDLGTAAALDIFSKTLTDFQEVYGVAPQKIRCDLHPDYGSSLYAHGQRRIPVETVQHHVAHILSCMADNGLSAPVLGVAFDGTGYGTEGTIWGGEFIRIENDSWRRIARIRPFPLPGGDQAAREPRRAALGLLYPVLGNPLFEREDLPAVAAFSLPERSILKRMLAKDTLSRRTSSAGRLFDAVAALLNIRQVNQFEGQAAMELEFMCGPEPLNREHPFPFTLESSPDTLMELDIRPMIVCLLAELMKGTARRTLARRFHRTLAAMILAVAQKVTLPKVALSGGCFQNHILTDDTITQLSGSGFKPYWHQQIPPNDGGIALGQAVYAHSAGVGQASPGGIPPP